MQFQLKSVDTEDTQSASKVKKSINPYFLSGNVQKSPLELAKKDLLLSRNPDDCIPLQLLEMILGSSVAHYTKKKIDESALFIKVTQEKLFHSLLSTNNGQQDDQMKEQCFVRIQLLCNMRDQINLFLDSIKESTFISLTIEGHYLLSDGASILVIDQNYLMFINALENALIINRPEVNEQIYFGKIKHYKPHMQGLLLESIDNKSVLLVCGLWNNADFAQGIYLRLNLQLKLFDIFFVGEFEARPINGKMTVITNGEKNVQQIVRGASNVDRK